MTEAGGFSEELVYYKSLKKSAAYTKFRHIPFYLIIINCAYPIPQIICGPDIEPDCNRSRVFNAEHS